MAEAAVVTEAEATTAEGAAGVARGAMHPAARPKRRKKSS
jgi:hypothetical protein